MAKKVPKTEEQPEATPKKKGNKLVLILAFILLAAAFVFGGSYLANKYILPKKAEAAKNDKTTISKDEVLVPISKFVVNLSGNSNNYQYIRLKVSCLVADKDASENLTKSMPLVRDSVISVLNSKTANDLLEANEGINNLKTAIKDKINQEYGQTIVKQVYITDLVIQ